MITAYDVITLCYVAAATLFIPTWVALLYLNFKESYCRWKNRRNNNA